MTKNIFRSVSLIVCLSLILSSIQWSPSVGLAAGAPEDNNVQPISRITEMDSIVSSPLWSPPATSSLLETARHQVAEQTAHPEPEPVDPDEPLPPGTVGPQEQAISYVYLPFVAHSISTESGNIERMDLRTRYAKTFQHPDGSGYALVYLEPIHFQATKGVWYEVDNTLIQDPEKPNAYRNTANDFLVQMAGDTQEIRSADGQDAGLLRLVDGEMSIEFTPVDIATSAGQVSGQSITYYDVTPGIDLTYSTRSDGIQMNYMVKEAPSRGPLLRTRIHVEGGTLESKGNILALRGQNVDSWTFSSLALAADGQPLDGVTWELADLGNGDYLLIWVASGDLLHGVKPGAPISINATITRGDNRDAYPESGYPDTPTGNQFNLYLGYDTWYAKARTRIFARFDDPNLPSGSSITNARAYFYQYAVEAGGTYQTRVCRVTQDWGEYTLTWNDQPNVTACSGYVGTGASAGWKYWTITSYAQAWQSGTNNYGILVQAQNEYAAGGIYYSRDCGASQCPGGEHPYMWIEYTTSPVLRIYDGLDLSPAAAVPEGTTVTVDFWVRNNGGATFNGSLRAYTNGSPTFSEQSVSISPNGGTYHYQKTQTFNNEGTYNVCAQYNDGSWHNLTAEGDGVACRTLNVVPPSTTDVRLTSGLELTPSEFEPGGGTVHAHFIVQNTSIFNLTENFVAQVTDGTNFSESGTQAMAPDASCTYDDDKSFTETGVHEVIAKHYVDGDWHALVGISDQEGSGFVRVKEPPPPPKKQEKGQPPSSGYSGEPVNTSTGNYFYNFTDLSDPTPGLSLAVTRWYNALDADEVKGPFGYGTSWTYNMTVTWRVDMSALVHMPDGHIAYFVGDVLTTTLLGTYSAQDDDVGTLERFADDTGVLTTTNQTAYHFDATGRLTYVTHPYPAAIIVIYSGDKPSQLIHSSGVIYDVAYDGDLITGVTSSSGRAVTYTYTISDDLETVTRPDGSVYTYTYDANHRLTEGQTPKGHAFVRNVYDGKGRVSQQYDQTGKLSTFSYGPTITETRTYTDALGSVITHTYDNAYRLAEEVDALGHVITYTRDAHGNVTARRDKNGEIWRYTYDDQSNMLSETDPLNNTWTYTYDERNHRTSQTDPLGNTWTYEYDGDGRLIHTVDPLSHAREYDYDDWGDLIWEQDENGVETWYGYNELGWRTAITDALGNVTRMAYNGFGNQTIYTDANGHVAAFVYDDLNRLVESADPMGTVITFTYDAMGNLLTESDGMEQLKYYTYDEYDRVIAETDFDGNTTRYGYDALGRQTMVTDALGHTTVYTYDAVGSLAARQDKDGAVTRYEYDPVGRLIRETDPLGRVTEYVYDAAGRQVEVRRPCDACAGGVAVSYTIYDTAGRMIQETDPRGATTSYAYDELGRLAVMTDTYGYTYTTTYDPAGRVIQETDPAGAATRYEYDLLGQLITTTNALGYQAVHWYDAVGLITQTANERGYTTTTTYDANDRVIAVTDALSNVVHNAYDADGRVISTTDSLSRTTTYTYDPNGNKLSETNPRGHTVTYVYDGLNHVIEVIEPLSCCGGGNSRSTSYDVMGRVISETDALSYTRLITYDAVGRRIAERSPLGYTTVYTYDNADNLIARQEPVSPLPGLGEGPGVRAAVWRFEYDANGNQVRQIDPLGQVQETEYDLLNRVVQDTDPLGAVNEREYDGADRMIASTNPRRATTHYAYDLLGRQVEETDPLGYTTVYTYDGAGNLVAVQDRRGFVSTYVYDGLNRQIAQTDALGHTRYTLYDKAGQIEVEIDYNGHTTKYTYDEAGNQVQVTDPLSGTTTTAYDALNLPVAVTDPLTRTRKMAYDALGRAISETTPLSHTTVYTYNAERQRTARTNALGHTWTTEYDAAGRAIHETDPLGRVITTTYDALGRVIASADLLRLGSGQALSRTTNYAYDPAGRLTALTGPDGTEQRYTYDPAGNVLTERDGNGHVTRYWYDLAGQLIRKSDPLGRIWRYTYDPEGNLVETITPSGRVIAQEYDALGRLVNKTHDGEQATAFAYDPNGNRTAMTSTLSITDTLGITATMSVTGAIGTVTDTLGVISYVYDDLNRLVESTENETRTVQYAYDEAGQQVSLTYPDGTIAHYAYDDDGNLSQVTAPDGGVTIYKRDALGRPTRVTQANGVVVETTYDALGNVLTIIQRKANGAIFARHAYTVDDADRRVQKVETLPQGTVTTDYAYDDLDRLVSSVASDGRETYYAFDDAGNRAAMWGMRAREGIIESFQIDYIYNAANQLVKTMDSATGATVYTYDADGHRTGERSFDRRVAYAYDAEGHLTQAAVKEWDMTGWAYKDDVYEGYAYDGDGRRARKVAVSANLGLVLSVREYRYDDSSGWDVLQTYDAAIADATESQFLYDQFLHKLAYWQGDDAGYFQNDGLGSVLGATDGSGDLASAGLMRYDDYGEELGPEGALPTDDSFTGYERDAYTGLDYARNRYYDPATGTFLTPDPFPMDRQDVLGLHRYLYVQANPVDYSDPLGLFIWTSASSGIIEWGDTLWGIAASYWGVSVYQVNWSMISAIQSFNSWIQNPNLIYAGSTLKLPTPLSAYDHLVFANQSAASNGTAGSECGQHNGGGSSGGGGGNGGGVTIDDRTRKSKFWKLFAEFSQLEYKDSTTHFKFHTGDRSVYVPPIPPIGFPGGTCSFEFRFDTFVRVYWESDKAVADHYQTGWCAAGGVEAKLEASIPAWGPLKIGGWGRIGGEIGVCLRGRWSNPHRLILYLEPYGKVSGEIGAKLYVWTLDKIHIWWF